MKVGVSHNRIALASVASAVALVSVGHLFYYKIFFNFFSDNLGAATGVFREDPVGWAVLVAHLGLGTLITLSCVHLSWVFSFGDGVKAGGLIGLLVGVGFSFDVYGATHIVNVTATGLDSVLWIVKGSIAGGVATWLLDKH